jgi:peptide/nickel transport system substrate-binding protein
VGALQNGEIDLIEQPAHDLLPIMEADENIVLFDQNPLGNQYMFRFNSLHPPFNDPRIRRAALLSMRQEDFLNAVIGDPKYYKTCAAMFVCGTTFATDKGGEVLVKSDPEAAKALLKEAGYDGTPIVLLHSTDLQVLTNLAPVAKQLLEKGGFKVDMQSSDWQTVVSRRTRKDPVNAGGWNLMLTSWVSADILNPVMTGFVNAACDKAAFGWPCDAEIEKLRDDFARETDPAKQKEIVEKVQMRQREVVTHIHLGQYYVPIATSGKVSGILTAAVPVFWNVEKK